MKKCHFFFAGLLIMVFLITPLSSKPIDHQENEIVIAMCRPHINQIKNVQHLFEKDILPFRKIKLIGIYHEDEVTDYSHSLQYVKENQLNWVSFEIIKGEVTLEKLFKINLWTEQFLVIFKRSQGIIFTGGMDFPPQIYGEDQHLLTQATTPIRTFYEVSFMFHLLGGSQNPNFKPFLETRTEYVVLGICLGCQTMNVACGGTLYQDIPMQVYGFETVQQILNAGGDQIHSSRYFISLYPLEKKFAPALHLIKFQNNRIFTNQMKMKVNDKPYVLSSHHQAIKKLGLNLKVAATSLDGKIVEAVEHKKYKHVLGIQFHPENYNLYMKGKFYQKAPNQTKDFNLRFFLEDNPPSMYFHKQIWQWFSQALSNR